MADNRRAKRVEKLKQKQEQDQQRQAELTYAQKLERVRLENQYVQNLANAHYHIARCNMIAVQLESKKVAETIDGAPKTEELLLAEYRRTKISASTCYRNAYFAKCDLNKVGVNDEEIDAAYIDYTEGPIKRDSYDEKYHRRSGAHFA